MAPDYAKLSRTFLMLFAFFSPISVAGANVSLVLALIFFLCAMAYTRRFEFAKNNANVPVLAFLAITGLSVLTSSDFARSLEGYSSMWVVLTYFLCVNNMSTVPQLKRTLNVLILSTTIAGAYGIFEHFTRINFFGSSVFNHDIWLKENPARCSGFFIHPLTFGEYLAMIIPLIFALLLHNLKNKKLMLVYGVSLFITLTALLFTYGIGPWLGLASGIILLLFLLVKRKAFMAGAGLIVAGSLLVLLLFPSSSPARKIRNITSPFNVSSAERFRVWDRSLRMIGNKPVFGVGWEAFDTAQRQYDPLKRRASCHTHNNFLNIGVETGLIGLGVFLWVVVVIFAQGIITLRNTRDIYLKTLNCGIMASLAAFLVSGMTDYSLGYSVIATLFYFLTGLLFAIPNLENSDRRESRATRICQKIEGKGVE